MVAEGVILFAKMGSISAKQMRDFSDKKVLSLSERNVKNLRPEVKAEYNVRIAQINQVEPKPMLSGTERSWNEKPYEPYQIRTAPA